MGDNFLRLHRKRFWYRERLWLFAKGDWEPRIKGGGCEHRGSRAPRHPVLYRWARQSMCSQLLKSSVELPETKGVRGYKLSLVYIHLSKSEKNNYNPPLIAFMFKSAQLQSAIFNIIYVVWGPQRQSAWEPRKSRGYGCQGCQDLLKRQLEVEFLGATQHYTIRLLRSGTKTSVSANTPRWCKYKTSLRPAQAQNGVVWGPTLSHSR